MKLYIMKTARGAYELTVVPGKDYMRIRLSAGEYEKVLEAMHRVEQAQGPYSSVIEIRGAK